MTLARRLRAQMQWRGIKSLNQLARLSGVPQSSIHRILARGDTYAPSLQTVRRLASALGTSTDRLLNDDAIGPAGRLLPTNGYDAELLAIMDKLPDDARRKILAVVRLIAASPAPPGE